MSQTRRNQLHLVIKSAAVVMLLCAAVYPVADSGGTPAEFTAPTTQAMALAPRTVPVKPAFVAVNAESYNGHIVLKLREGLDIEKEKRHGTEG